MTTSVSLVFAALKPVMASQQLRLKVKTNSATAYELVTKSPSPSPSTKVSRSRALPPSRRITGRRGSFCKQIDVRARHEILRIDAELFEQIGRYRLAV